MDALDSFEDLTELGHHLVDMPIEPRLGKMIVYSVILKCLDPILTIACTLAYKEPCKFSSLYYHHQWVTKPTFLAKHILTDAAKVSNACMYNFLFTLVHQ